MTHFTAMFLPALQERQPELYRALMVLQWDSTNQETPFEPGDPGRIESIRWSGGDSEIGVDILLDSGIAVSFGDGSWDPVYPFELLAHSPVSDHDRVRAVRLTIDAFNRALSRAARPPAGTDFHDLQDAIDAALEAGAVPSIRLSPTG